MKMTLPIVVLTVAIPLLTHASFRPTDWREDVNTSAAVFRASVLRVECQGGVAPGESCRTEVTLGVEEVFKGRLPSCLKVVQSGGECDGRGFRDSLFVDFKPGESRLLLVFRRADRSLGIWRGLAGAVRLSAPLKTAAEGGAGTFGDAFIAQIRTLANGSTLAGGDLRDQAADPAASVEFYPPAAPHKSGAQSTTTNLMTGNDGIAARFLQPDRGEGIPYWVDADYLPTGMTQAQALGAVKDAVNAWALVASVRFDFAGVRSFGMAVGTVPNDRGELLIQLHDHYNSIIGGGGDALGVGGHSWTTGTTPSGWTTGGAVAGNDFHQVLGGSVVLKHTDPFMQNLTNFSEVLCHEIGHAIGLGHASANPNEPNPLLSQAIMYYLVHGNGRGATPAAWDMNVARQAHPVPNTPPYCYPRMLDAIHSPVPLADPRVNRVEVPGFDLQDASLTFAMADGSAINGAFSTPAEGAVQYTPFAWYGSDSERLDPTGNAFWDRVFVRWSDGVNASPYAVVKVVSLLSDFYGEGIPDSWRQAWFGSASPSAGPNRRATNDFDGDGFSNSTEWRLGSNPADKASNLRLSPPWGSRVTWRAKGHELYQLYSSTNLIAWTRAGNPVLPTNDVPGTNVLNLSNSTGTISGLSLDKPGQFFRLRKVP